MPSYEVATEDLLSIRDQLSAQAVLLGSTRTTVTAATTAMVDQIDGGLAQAQTVIDAVLADLIGLVAAADAAAGMADWLGPDAEIFRAANADLSATIGRSRSTVETALIAHRAATTQLGRVMAATLEELDAEAGRSADLSAQLSAAVGAEADSYEAAFNGSWDDRAATPVPGGDPPAQTPEDEDDWDGIGDPDKEWHKGKEWQHEYRNGTGRDPKDPGVDIDPVWEHTLFETHPEAAVGVLKGSFGEESGFHGEGELDAAKAEAQAKATAGLSLTDGAFISAGAGASAVLGAAQGKVGYGPVTGQAQGYLLGAEASADAKGSIGPDGAQGSFHSEAFVGGKAEGELSAEYAGVTAGVGGEVSYGVGAHADADASFTSERVGVSVDVGASLGLGAGVKFDVSIDPSDVVDALGDLF
jgi:hypothetical protein